MGGPRTPSRDPGRGPLDHGASARPRGVVIWRTTFGLLLVATYGYRDAIADGDAAMVQG